MMKNNTRHRLWFKLFKQILGDNVIGVDISLNSKADIIADAHALPFRSKAFESAISVETIEHLENPEKFIEEAKRVTKKHIAISTVNSYTGKHDERHVREFNTFSLRKLLKKHGVKIMDYGFGGIGGKKLGWVVRRLRFLQFILPWWLWCEWICVSGVVDR